VRKWRAEIFKTILQIFSETDIEHSESVLAANMFETIARSVVFFLRSSEHPLVLFHYMLHQEALWEKGNMKTAVQWIDTTKIVIVFLSWALSPPQTLSQGE